MWYNLLMLYKETAECIKFHHWLKLRDIWHTHVPNEGNGNGYAGSLKKKMGVSAGFPDYIILLPVGDFGTPVPVAIEMKKPDGGVTSPAQKEWLAELEKAGFKTAVCHGASEAVIFLKRLGYKDTMPDFKKLACPF